MLYIIQNDPEVPPGFLPDLLDAEGVSYRVVRPGEGEALPAPSLTQAVVVLGGRMGAKDVAEHPFLADVRHFLVEAAEHGAAILGICLGGQMLADVLGGELRPSHRGEKGVHGLSLTPLGCLDPLFHNLPYAFVSYQWHSDSFDLPEGAVLLAGSSGCPHQAFRYDEKVYGVQFHPEVTAEIVRAWAQDEAECPARYEADFEKAAAVYRETGEILFRNFLRIARLVKSSH